MSGETFGQMLRRLRTERGLRQNALAKSVGVDPAYVNQIERELRGTSGCPKSPRRPICLALARGLGLDDAETDRFLFAAGLAPAEDWQLRAEAAEGRLEMLRGVFEAPSDLLVFRRRTG